MTGLACGMKASAEQDVQSAMSYLDNGSCTNIEENYGLIVDVNLRDEFRQVGNNFTIDELRPTLPAART